MGDLFARRTVDRRQRWRIWCGLCAAGSFSVLSAQRPPTDFVRADAAIGRLEPRLFSELDIPQGTLDLMILTILAASRCTATASRSG